MERREAGLNDGDLALMYTAMEICVACHRSGFGWWIRWLADDHPTARLWFALEHEPDLPESDQA